MGGGSARVMCASSRELIRNSIQKWLIHLNVKLSEAENGKHVSILDLPGDVLIIPQATLGGRVKGRKEGLELYSQFVYLCEKELAANSKRAAAGVVVEHGTCGSRQIVKLDTNGPYTHLIEFQRIRQFHGCFLVYNMTGAVIRFSFPLS